MDDEQKKVDKLADNYLISVEGHHNMPSTRYFQVEAYKAGYKAGKDSVHSEWQEFHRRCPWCKEEGTDYSCKCKRQGEK